MNEAPTYTAEAWFSVLTRVCQDRRRKDVADLLGISKPALSQVLNGSGLYGTGQASTARIAERVTHTFGRYVCPHLTEQAEAEEQREGVVITAEQCRTYAHRPVPVGSPRELQHWQACQRCPHRVATTPVQPRPVIPRKSKAAAPATSTTEATDPQES